MMEKTREVRNHEILLVNRRFGLESSADYLFFDF